MTNYETKDSGERAEFESGMRRDTEAGKPRFDLMVPEGIPYEEQLLTRFAALLGRGAEKYTERNWELANSEAELARARSSAFRHFFQWFTGETDEDHAAATIFNLMVCETVKGKIEAAAEEEPLTSAEICEILDREFPPQPQFHLDAVARAINNAFNKRG